MPKKKRKAKPTGPQVGLIDPETSKPIEFRLRNALKPFAARIGEKIEITIDYDTSKPDVLGLFKKHPNFKMLAVLDGNLVWSPLKIGEEVEPLFNALFSLSPILQNMGRFEIHVTLNLIEESGKFKMVHAPFTTQQIMIDTEKLIKKFAARYEAGDEEALFELLEISPAFVDLPFISKAVNSWIKNRDGEKIKRLEGKRGKGRPEKEMKWSYFYMVEAMRKADPELTIEAACAKLAEFTFLGEEPEAGTVREYYFDCKKRLAERTIILRYQPDIRECAIMPGI